ncbi:MAG TPA: hypothetical protein VKR53_06500 [Puia sp.]|nr:hypothetical protein [Puia sp.]
MNNVQQEFIRKGLVIMQPGDEWFIMSKKNAIEFVEACKNAGIEILGIDGFYLHENNIIEPSMKDSIDFTSKSTYYGETHKRSKEFIMNKNDDLYFEIVCSANN